MLCIVAVTIERYFEIVDPLLHRVKVSRRIAIAAIAVWFGGLSFNIMELAGVSRVINGVCVIAFCLNDQARQATMIRNFVGEYFIPISVIAFEYAAMIYKMHSRVRPFQLNGKSAVRDYEIRRNLLRTLLTVTAFLIIFNTPKQVLVLMFGFGVYEMEMFAGVSYNASVVLVYWNTCINPFIYKFQFKEFQRGMASLFRCQQCRRQKIGSMASSVAAQVAM